MFEELDRVDWAALHHGRGSAADLPAVLRRWSAGGPSGPVWDRLCHTGNVWGDAAPTAVPFVAEVATTAGPARREAVALLVSMWTALPFSAAAADTRSCVERAAPAVIEAAAVDDPALAALLALVTGRALSGPLVGNDPLLAAVVDLAGLRTTGRPLDDRAFDALRRADEDLAAFLDDLGEGEPLGEEHLPAIVDFLLEDRRFC